MKTRETITLDARAQPRLMVLTHILARDLDPAIAAQALELSERQVHRLTERLRTQGAAGLVHGNRGRVPVNRTSELRRSQVVESASGSLAVEEQFYLVWPPILWLAWRIDRRWPFVVAMIGAMVTTGIRIDLADAPNAITRVQFGSDTRGDALLLGCAFALIMDAGWHRWAGRILASVATPMRLGSCDGSFRTETAVCQA